jgi:hypothetical protein
MSLKLSLYVMGMDQFGTLGTLIAQVFAELQTIY